MILLSSTVDTGSSGWASKDDEAWHCLPWEKAVQMCIVFILDKINLLR